MAFPVVVEPVEPVAPDVADGLPQLPVMVTQGATTTAGPELPELPELPEFPDCAVPVAVAAPVLPELASPELAYVWFELEELAFPDVPPVVEPLAVELPLWPDAAVAVEALLALPVSPERALPLAAPDQEDPGVCPEPHWPPRDPPSDPLPEPAGADPVAGTDVAEPLSPESFSEVLPALADPVDPVGPDCVLPFASALPDEALEPEFDIVPTGPDEPPFPESPETATGLEVALPVRVDPVDPVAPDHALWLSRLDEPFTQGDWSF